MHIVVEFERSGSNWRLRAVLGVAPRDASPPPAQQNEKPAIARRAIGFRSE